ncbi:MAG: hypothetical protein ACFFEF_07780 [Candidatus Thorarchaeota archaeon]
MDAKDSIAEAEEIIESAIWESRISEDWDWELAEYRKATKILVDLKDLEEDVERERKRVLSFCLMRIDEALVKLGREEDAVRRAQESLQYAIESGNEVQIARSKLALGIRFLNEEQLSDAELYLGEIITEGIDSIEEDMLQVVGWALLVRASILKGKSLYNQALLVAHDAAGILSGIGNYAGLAQVYSLIAKLQMDVGNPEEAKTAEEMSESYSQKANEFRK